MKSKIEEKRKENEGVYSLIFQTEEPVSWRAGQYMVLNIPHANPDNRGVTRHFTISSAPFQKKPMITTRYLAEEGSSFKRALFAKKQGDTAEVLRIDGEFTLNKEYKKLVFIAGGVGITPYHAMLLELEKERDDRDIILIYSNRDKNNIVFKDTLDRLEKEYNNLRLVNIFSPQRADANLIKEVVPDLAERAFYLSGPIGLVKAVEEVLRQFNISRDHIRKDYFPRVDE